MANLVQNGLIDMLDIVFIASLLFVAFVAMDYGFNKAVTLDTFKIAGSLVLVLVLVSMLVAASILGYQELNL